VADKTHIEWTEATWNPVTGCSKVSAGCKHCYAEREWARLSANLYTRYHGRSFTDVQCHGDVLTLPLRWRRPRRIFVNSMSDLFHESVPDLFIADVFGVMAATPQHTYQVLTKRPERMRRLLGGGNILNFVTAAEECAAMYSHAHVTWPLSNVHLGVSIEDQATADERIPLLLQTPAAVRWISAEPLLGDVDLSELIDRLDWVVVGGESGPNARPLHPDWARSLRDQSIGAGIPFLFKQWGEFLSAELDECPCGPPDSHWMWADGTPWTRFDGQRGIPLFRRVGKKAAGRLLDGIEYSDYPVEAPF
jgi:protein gp37